MPQSFMSDPYCYTLRRASGFIFFLAASWPCEIISGDVNGAKHGVFLLLIKLGMRSDNTCSYHVVQYSQGMRGVVSFTYEIVIVKEKSLRKAVEMCFSGKCIMTIIEPTFQRVKARTSQARAEKNCGITTAHDNNNRG